MNLGPRDEPGEVDLHAERYDVRQAAKRSTYTGKTYNSLDNISQFFDERGHAVQAARQAAAAEAGFTDAAAVSAARSAALRRCARQALRRRSRPPVRARAPG